MRVVPLHVYDATSTMLTQAKAVELGIIRESHCDGCGIGAPRSPRVQDNRRCVGGFMVRGCKPHGTMLIQNLPVEHLLQKHKRIRRELTPRASIASRVNFTVRFRETPRRKVYKQDFQLADRSAGNDGGLHRQPAKRGMEVGARVAWENDLFRYAPGSCRVRSR